MHVRLNFNRIRWLSGLQGNFHLPKPAEHRSERSAPQEEIALPKCS